MCSAEGTLNAPLGERIVTRVAAGMGVKPPPAPFPNKSRGDSPPPQVSVGQAGARPADCNARSLRPAARPRIVNVLEADLAGGASMPGETSVKRRRTGEIALLVVGGPLLAFALVRSLRPRFSMEEFDTIFRQTRALYREWRRSRPGTRDAHRPNDVCLVVDTERPAMWLERNGAVAEDEICELPKGFSWEIHHLTPCGRARLTSPVRLRQRGNRSERNIFQEMILVHGYGGSAGIHMRIRHGGFGCGYGRLRARSFSFTPRRNAGGNVISASMLVTDDKETMPSGFF